MSAKTRSDSKYSLGSTGIFSYKRANLRLIFSCFCGHKVQNYKMKLVLAVALLVACAAAAPQRQDSKNAVIVKYESDNIGVDGYNYAYETSDGTSAQEQGTLQNAGSENESIAVRGQFSFVGADGVTYTVQYIADENGFQPQGAHLPHS